MQIANERIASLREELTTSRYAIEMSNKDLSQAYIDVQKLELCRVSLESDLGTSRGRESVLESELRDIRVEHTISKDELNRMITENVAKQNTVEKTQIIEAELTSVKKQFFDSRHSNEMLSKEIARLWEELNTSEQSRLTADQSLLTAHKRISELDVSKTE